MRSDAERSKQGIIQKSDEDRRRNSDFKLFATLTRILRSTILKELDTAGRKTQEFA